MTQESTPPAWAGQPGSPHDRPLTDPYVTVGGDSLPSVAELYGHAGEWQAIAEANVGHVWADYNNLQPGLQLAMPAGWLAEAEAKDTPQDLSGLTASQLADRAAAATTLTELDAIDAAGGGRSSVRNAVSARRSELLAAGATA